MNKKIKKLSIKTRVFLSFLIFIIFIVNIFAYLLFFLVSTNIKDNTQKSIINEFETIKTFIDLQESNIFTLPQYEIEKINNLGFYFKIGNNDNKLKSNYYLGFKEINNNIIFRGDYNSFTIIIGKNNKDFIDFKNLYFQILIILNIILIIGLSLISYLITYFSLKPLFNLSNFLNNNNFNSNSNLLKNYYGNSEIGILTQSINNFIKKNNSTLETQTNFIQDVSHELKTPLMQIESNIELIENKITEEKTKNRLESIKNSVGNISEIISNLGFILRGENILRNKEKINIYNYFSNFIKKYEILADKKNIKLNIIKTYDLILENNNYYLDRLFGNLLSNAIFYNKGENKIDIIINKNNIIIRDNGIGIEKKELEKMFSRFYRNQNSGIYYRNGNGLGLVIVKKITDLFGWKIQVKSKIGKGSEFIILFTFK